MSKDRSDISRNNGARSRGPVTIEGKARSSQNARKHGILSKSLVLPGESPADYEALVASVGEELGADGIIEWQFVEQIANAIWRQRRLGRAERASILFQSAGHPQFGTYQQAVSLDHPAAASDSIEFQRRFRTFSMDLASLPKNADQIARYQATLENSLAKALRGFREAQEHRLRSLPAANDPGDDVADGEFVEVKK